MRFFHIGDLHFGKMLHNVPLIEDDQPFWVEQFLQKVDEYAPDAVVIAGDVFDRRVPPPEALQLFDHLLTELAARDTYVFVIPGNHDSAVRLAHVHELLESHHIYIAGELSRELLHVTVPARKLCGNGAASDRGGAEQGVTFWLMPYLFPKLVSDPRVLGREDITTYDGAVRALLEEQDMDPDACNVLVAHQNVLANGVAPEHSESETIIGGVGEIDCSAMDAFDYVALGHIHNAQKVGRETVRYAGCPLYYDFSEIHRSKDLTMVTVRSAHDIGVEMIPIPLRHRLLQCTGTLEELLRQGADLNNKEQYYIQCILSDRHVPPRAMEQLREVFGGQLVNVRRAPADPSLAAAEDRDRTAGAGELKRRSLEEEFSSFYQMQQNELPDGDQEALVRKILEQQARHSGDFVADARAVPAEDSEELLTYLLAEIESEEQSADSKEQAESGQQSSPVETENGQQGAKEDET